MLYYTSRLKTYNIDATDGEMGKIKDLYFDDKKWAIRYAIIDTRKWLPGRKVLLSPTSFVNMDNDSENLEVKYDKEAVRSSPEIPEETAISKDVEDSITGYYGWNRYWAGNMLWGAIEMPWDTIPRDEMTEDQTRYNQQMEEQQVYDLRSENETLDYKVHANDGKIGRVTDMIYDDQNWKIRYLVVRSSASYVVDKFLVFDTEEIESVDWFEKDIYINGSVEEVNHLKIFEEKEGILPTL